MQSKKTFKKRRLRKKVKTSQKEINGPSLHEVIKKLEKEKTIVFTFLILLVASLVFNIYLFKTGLFFKYSNNYYIHIGICCLISSFPTYFSYKSYKKYRALYKNNIIKSLISSSVGEHYYDHNTSISKNLYDFSKLFRKRYDDYSGDDYLKFKHGSTLIELSELHTTYTTRNSKGESRTHTIFKGLFISADFNKHIAGETYVIPDIAERLLGRFGRFLQDNKFSKYAEHLIHLENPKFEKMFKTYGSDQIESRYCLTPTMMEGILKMQSRFKRSIKISFIGSRINIAISFNEALFEPPIFRSINSSTKEVSLILNSVLKIIDDLELNKRIWTKEAA